MSPQRRPGSRSCPARAKGELSDPRWCRSRWGTGGSDPPPWPYRPTWSIVCADSRCSGSGRLGSRLRHPVESTWCSARSVSSSACQRKGAVRHLPAARARCCAPANWSRTKRTKRTKRTNLGSRIRPRLPGIPSLPRYQHRVRPPGLPEDRYRVKSSLLPIPHSPCLADPRRSVITLEEFSKGPSPPDRRKSFEPNDIGAGPGATRRGRT